MENKIIKRVRYAEGMKLREAGEGESRVIEGCAVVFGKETILWDGTYERIREVIDKSCFEPEFLAQQDIKLNLLHDRSSSIARCNRGKGTLNLELREDGLWFSAEMPRCDLGDRALALVGNETYTGCSFEFYEDEYTEERSTLADGREDVLITHTKMKAVSALTLAMDPAYEETSVKVREAMERECDKKKEEENTDSEEEQVEDPAEEPAEEPTDETLDEDKKREIRMQVEALSKTADLADLYTFL